MEMMTTKQVATRIASIETNKNKLRESIQECALSCVAHAIQHGDVTLATRLVHACEKAVDLHALVGWFTLYGPMRWSKETNAFKLSAAKAKELRVTFDFAEFVASVTEPWYDFAKAAKDLKPVDLEKLLLGIVDRAKKAQDDGREILHADVALFLQSDQFKTAYGTFKAGRAVLAAMENATEE